MPLNIVQYRQQKSLWTIMKHLIFTATYITVMGRLNDTDRQPKNGSGRELAQNTFFFVIIPRCTNFVYK